MWNVLHLLCWHFLSSHKRFIGFTWSRLNKGGGRGGEGRGGEGEEDELEVDTFQQFPKLLEYSDEAVQKNSQKYVRIQNVSIAVTYRPVRALEVSQLIHS